jgi:hypothetical protein
MSLKTKMTSSACSSAWFPPAFMGAYRRAPAPATAGTGGAPTRRRANDKPCPLRLLERWAAEVRILARSRRGQRLACCATTPWTSAGPPLETGKDYDELHTPTWASRRSGPSRRRWIRRRPALWGDDGPHFFPLPWARGGDPGRRTCAPATAQGHPCRAFEKALQGETPGRPGPLPGPGRRARGLPGRPVRDHNGKVEGWQPSAPLPPGAVNGRMGLRSGLGESGETYWWGRTGSCARTPPGTRPPAAWPPPLRPGLGQGGHPAVARAWPGRPAPPRSRLLRGSRCGGLRPVERWPERTGLWWPEISAARLRRAR